MMGSIVPFVTQTTWKQSTKATAFLPLRLPKYSGLKESSVRGVSERVVPQDALGSCCTRLPFWVSVHDGGLFKITLKYTSHIFK